MDRMVEAVKKIAEGDITITVPVMSEDEIGQFAGLHGALDGPNTRISRIIGENRGLCKII